MGLTPNPLVMAAHMTGDKEKPKLTIDRPRLSSMRMQHLANLLSYPPMRGIGLGSLGLVIKKGEGRAVHCHCHVVGSGPGRGGPAMTRRGTAAWEYDRTSEGIGHIVKCSGGAFRGCPCGYVHVAA